MSGLISAYYPLLPGRTHQQLIHAGNAPLRYLEVECLDLPAGGAWARPADGREVVIVPLSGEGVIGVGNAGGPDWKGTIARRGDVFAAAPSAAYVPPPGAVSVSARTPLQAVLVSAAWPEPAAPPTILPAGAVTMTSVGSGLWEREVRTIFGPEGVTARLLVGETINPPGHWSGMPPHKHDEAGAGESLLEEVYYYRLSPPDGYVVQLLYDREGGNAALHITAEGAVAIHRGYHPTVAPPGVTGYYLWALAGPEKSYRVSIDPAFEWMRAEARS